MLKLQHSLTAILIMFSIVGCDTARDARRSRYNSNALDNSNSYNWGNNNNNNGGVTVDNGGNTNGSGSGTTIPSEISHCSWASDGLNGFASNSSHLGQYTVCKSSTKETDLYIQVKNPVTNVQVCLIPTSTSNSAQVYIGEPRCLMLSDNKRVYKVPMLKNRSGFSHMPLNSVMIMKDESHPYPHPFNQYVLTPDAFIFCSNYFDQTGYSGYCDAFKDVGAYALNIF